MIKKNSTKLISFFLGKKYTRQKIEFIIIILIVTVVSLLTYAENRIINLGTDFPISNTILMFILININLLLLILLIFLVFRNIVKLLYDTKRKVMGAKLRMKLVVAFIALSLLPTIVLFFFSINFITTSIEFWFNVPVEKALENSLVVGKSLYSYVDNNNSFFLERISYQIKTKKLLLYNKRKALSRYIKVVQRAFNLHGVEIYAKNFNRITFALSPEIQNQHFETIQSDILRKCIKTKVKSVTQCTSNGELIKTIATIPFGASGSNITGYAVLSVLIPPDLYKNMISISKGFEEYQHIKLLKKPIQITYFLTLSIVALIVVFCAVWFGFYLAKSITVPMMELAEGTRRVAEGDLNFRIDLVANDEIGSLVNSFNIMTRDLQISREQLEFSARMLREQNREIEKRRQYIEIVLKDISAGVISLDEKGFITTINKSAEKMLNLKPKEILYKKYEKLLYGQHLALAKEILENLSNSRDNTTVLPLRLTIDGKPRSFMTHVNALKDDKGYPVGIVMVFDDLTEIEKAQRMAAWREVARRIAHEVKNPLTPITLSAQRLKRKYSQKLNEHVFDECTQMIIEHVELIRNLVNEFSTFARFPQAILKPCELTSIIEESVALFRKDHNKIYFQINITDNIPLLNLDKQQIKQAMINLIDNAISAIQLNDGFISFTLTHDPILNMVRIEIADNGTGISDEDKTRLFEPYFSTKKSGMGLGLTIVSTIIADHNGMISVQDNQPKGAKFVIELYV